MTTTMQLAQVDTSQSTLDEIEGACQEGISACGGETLLESGLWDLIQRGASALAVLIAIYGLFIIVTSLARGNIGTAGKAAVGLLVAVPFLLNLQLIFTVVDVVERVVEESLEVTEDIVEAPERNSTRSSSNTSTPSATTSGSGDDLVIEIGG